MDPLVAPGALHELETVLLNGRLQNVYTRLWPSLRAFWLDAVDRYAHDTYVVCDDPEIRLTYAQVHARTCAFARLLAVHGVEKGLS